MKRALILGVGGQDGSYLAELLLDKGYEVHGMYRRSSVNNLARIAPIKDRLTLHRGDLADHLSIDKLLQWVLPHEVYNLADQDHVDWSRSIPDYNTDITYGAVVRILESLKTISYCKNQTRFFQPISSTVFGNTESVVDENSCLAPASPYAISKSAAWLACKHYRREYGLWVSCGIMWNHDSPRRGPDYLLQKIVRHIQHIRDPQRLMEVKKLPLYNLQSRVDIGYAREYMEAAHSSLQQEEADDYCVGTGRSRTIGNIVCEAYQAAGLTWHDWIETDRHPPAVLPLSPQCQGKEGRATTRLKWFAHYNAITLAVAMVKGEIS